MPMQPYHFKPNSLDLEQQADGNWIARFELATYQGQWLSYTNQGVNADDYFVIDVEVHGDEIAPVTYHQGTTSPFDPGAAIGVELVCKRDGKRKGSIIASM